MIVSVPTSDVSTFICFCTTQAFRKLKLKKLCCYEPQLSWKKAFCSDGHRPCTFGSVFLLHLRLLLQQGLHCLGCLKRETWGNFPLACLQNIEQSKSIHSCMVCEFKRESVWCSSVLIHKICCCSCFSFCFFWIQMKEKLSDSAFWH